VGQALVFSFLPFVAVIASRGPLAAQQFFHTRAGGDMAVGAGKSQCHQIGVQLLSQCAWACGRLPLIFT
jgi:hypothetical protein